MFKTSTSSSQESQLNSVKIVPTNVRKGPSIKPIHFSTALQSKLTLNDCDKIIETLKRSPKADGAVK